MEKIAYEVVEWKYMKQDFFFSSKLTTEPRCGFLRPKTLLEGIREVIRLQDL